MKFCDFEYAAPDTPAEVIQLLASRLGDAKIIAGGQSLLPTMAYRLAQPALLVDIRNLKGLSEIVVNQDGVRLGARTRWRDIEDSQELETAHPLLKEAIKHVAHYQIRNRGTVGGSLAHADPASEMPGVAMTCEAKVRVVGPAGERVVDIEDFFTGTLSTSLAEDELLLEVLLPAWKEGRRWGFREFSRRDGDFALAGIVLYYDLDQNGKAENTHIGVIGACQQPTRLVQAEQFLNGKELTPEVIRAAAKVAAAESEPGEDMHAGIEYRKALVATLLQRTLEDAVKRQ